MPRHASAESWMHVSALPRVAIFIDGWNFKCAAYDGLGIDVDFDRLLEYLSRGRTLLRAYYYGAEMDDETIELYLRMAAFNERDAGRHREFMRAFRKGMNRFLRYLNRHGYLVVKKPARVRRDKEGDVRISGDVDLELAIDMLTLAPRTDEQVLVSGDGDFVPLLERVGRMGVRTTVVSTALRQAFERAHYRASTDLLDAADVFVELNSIRHEISKEAGRRPEVAEDTVETFFQWLKAEMKHHDHLTFRYAKDHVFDTVEGNADLADELGDVDTAAAVLAYMINELQLLSQQEQPGGPTILVIRE